MIRPYVKIRATNELDSLRAHLDAMLPRFTRLDGVVGLTLNGGMSRDYADHLSEVDVTFFLEPDTFQQWQRGKTPIALGITMLGGRLYDIKVVDYAAERERVWDPVTLWDASYAEILHDPDGRLHDLYAEKLGNAPDIDAVEGLLMSCWWYYELAGEIWIHREDPLQGHHMLNQAIDRLVQALFAANREHIPHEKWLLHLSRTLAWRPQQWEARLGAAMSTGDMTVASVIVRRDAIRQLWEEIDDYVRATCTPQLPVRVMQRSFYEHLRLLVEAGSLSIEEWQSLTGGGIPNYDPFHPITKLEEGRIVVDRDALLGIEPEAMYQWHYEVLEAVAAQVRNRQT